MLIPSCKGLIAWMERIYKLQVSFKLSKAHYRVCALEIKMYMACWYVAYIQNDQPIFFLSIYLFVFTFMFVSINLPTGLEWYSAVTLFAAWHCKKDSYFFLPHPSIITGDISCGTAVSLFSISSLSFFCSGTRFSPVWSSKG